MQEVGIFEAKAKLSDLCLQVDEFGASYVITRRGRPVARLVGIGCEDSPTRTSILSRMEKTNALLGAIGQEEPDFPDVWLERTSGAVSPLEEAGSE